MTEDQFKALYPDTNERVVRFRSLIEQTVALAGVHELDDFDREVVFSQNVWSQGEAKGGFNYRTVYMSSGTAPILQHELGHTLGFEHAQSIAHYCCPPYYWPNGAQCSGIMPDDCPFPSPGPFRRSATTATGSTRWESVDGRTSALTIHRRSITSIRGSSSVRGG